MVRLRNIAALFILDSACDQQKPTKKNLDRNIKTF